MKITIEIPNTTRSQVRAAGEILAQIAKAAGRATGHGLAIARGLEYTRAVYRALPAELTTEAQSKGAAGSPSVSSVPSVANTSGGAA